MSEKTKKRLLNGIFIFFLVVVLGYFALGELLLPADDWGDSDNFQVYTGEWNCVHESGRIEKIKLPTKCKARRGEVLKLQTVLPAKIEDDSYLCYRSAKQDLKFYVDGELRQEYSTKKTRLFGRDSAVAYIFLKLQDSDAGKLLEIDTRADSSYSGIFYTVYIGGMMDIWEFYFSKYGAELLVAMLLIALSIITIIGSLILTLRIRYQNNSALAYLGLAVFIAGIWLLSNSVFRQLFSPNLSVINDIPFCAIMLLPIPYLIYMNEVQKNRYRLLYRGAQILATIDFVVCTVLHVCHIVDYTQTITYMTCVCVLMILVMVVGIVADIVHKRIGEYFYVAIGLLGAFISAIIQIVVYFRRTTLFSGVYLAIGLLWLLIFAVISTIRDLRSLEEDRTQAVVANESKGRFLANMSHEIRTPINVVLGLDAVILRESTEPAIKEYALDIQNAGKTLLSLVNDILDLSKIESGKMEIIPTKYDFSSLVHDVINMISVKAANKNLKLNLRLDENIPSGLYGDDVRIRQVLVNLLNNAVKYTKEGSVTLLIWEKRREDFVEDGQKKKRIWVHFSVRDTGVGIKKEDIGKLFAEFERIEEDENRYIEGTGLGMSITTQILHMMNSSLQLDSEYGKGSEFFFDLEQEIWDDAPIGNLEERIKNNIQNYFYRVAFEAPDADILVVDDNYVNRKVFRNLLKGMRMRIDDAESGEDCLEMVQEKHYDLIFLDHMMPKMDGIETLRRMKQLEHSLCKDTPVIALTANAVVGAKEIYMSEGFHDYLSKPIDTDRLEKMLVTELPEEKIIYIEEEETGQPEEEIEEQDFSLPEIPGVEWGYALHKMKSERVLMETVEDFYSLAEPEAKDLEKYFQEISDGKEGALADFRVKVHSMKSSAALIGAMPLSGLARVLEFAAAEGNETLIYNLMPDFLKEWRQLKGSLSVLFPEQEIKKRTPEYSVLSVYLNLLKSSLTDMDIDTADGAVKELQTYQYTEEQERIVEQLALSVAAIDVEKTVALSDRLMELLKNGN